jgi:hypothetical protein
MKNWILAVFVALMSEGSGFFASPNMNAIMSSVQPGQRGIAAGTRAMLMNTGQVLNKAIAFPLVQLHTFGYYCPCLPLPGSMNSTLQARLDSGMGICEAFPVSFAVTLVATLVSFSFV